jgi:hypothetical protein
MSNALAPASKQTTSVAAALNPYAMSREQLQLVKTTICSQPLSDDELQLVGHICERLRLDPLCGEAYVSKMKGPVSVQGSWHGLLRRAEDSGGLDGAHPEPVRENGKLAAAKATVYRRGCSHPFVYEARPELEGARGDGRAWTYPLLVARAMRKVLEIAFPSPGVQWADEGESFEDQAKRLSADEDRSTSGPRRGDVGATSVEVVDANTGEVSGCSANTEETHSTPSPAPQPAAPVFEGAASPAASVPEGVRVPAENSHLAAKNALANLKTIASWKKCSVADAFVALGWTKKPADKQVPGALNAIHEVASNRSVLNEPAVDWFQRVEQLTAKLVLEMREGDEASVTGSEEDGL